MLEDNGGSGGLEIGELEFKQFKLVNETWAYKSFNAALEMAENLLKTPESGLEEYIITPSKDGYYIWVR